mmetsp:Transcript_7664/g.17201  ORF Transcript_7664/g.17201 Transcript_7664/m.17201 type:complete len:338 (-) Transcript_7664:276-1289(-)
MRGTTVCVFAALQLLFASCSTVCAVVEGTEATTPAAGQNNANKNNADIDIDIDIDASIDGDGDDTFRMQEFLNYWETLSSNESLVSTYAITELMKCDHLGNDIEDPNAYSLIPTDQDYSLLVEAYVHASKTNPNPRAGRPPSVTTYNPEVFLVPTEVKAISNIGRGVFALEDVEKGTMINRPTNAIEFHSREIFRDFMAYLIKKRARLRCDLFLWFYATRKSPEDGDYIICLDADHTSLINSAEGYDEDNGDDEDDDDDENDDDDDDDEEEDDEYDDEYNFELNVGQSVVVTGDERIYGCQDPPTYALRDIKAGEELRMSYGDFSEPELYEHLGFEH